MKYTKKRRNNRNDARREATWEKFKKQQNQFSADRRGLKIK